MSFDVRLSKIAERNLAKIPKRDGERIRTALRILEYDPYPPAARKLVNVEAWRVRIGNYRIIYDVREQELLVLVITIGHRKDVYR